MIKLADHQIYCYSHFQSAFEEASPVFADLARAPAHRPAESEKQPARTETKRAASWLPEALHPAVVDRYENENVLIPDSGGRVADMYTAVHELVNGKRLDRCVVKSLSPLCMQLLNKGNLYVEDMPLEERLPHQLSTVMSRAASKRILSSWGNVKPPQQMLLKKKDKSGRVTSVQLILPIEIGELLVYHFSTDLIITQLAVSAALPDDFPCNDQLMTELADHFGRFANLSWLKMPAQISKQTLQDPSDALIEIEGFTIGTLVSRLVLGQKAQTQKSFRNFIYSYVQAQSDQKFTPEEQAFLCARLAKQMTTDYALKLPAAGIETIEEFSNKVHNVTREGGATFVWPVTDGREVEFLNNYRTGTLEINFLPIIVLTLHQHFEALDIALFEEDPSVSEEKNWWQLQDRLAVLNTNFRFHQISQIGEHNRFNTKLRKVFELDDMENVLAQDMNRMAMRAQTQIAMNAEKQARQFRKRYAWLYWCGSGAMAVLLFLESVLVIHAFTRDNVTFWEWFTIIPVVLIFILAVCFAKKSEIIK